MIEKKWIAIYKYFSFETTKKIKNHLCRSQHKKNLNQGEGQGKRES